MENKLKIINQLGVFFGFVLFFCLFFDKSPAVAINQRRSLPSVRLKAKVKTAKIFALYYSMYLTDVLPEYMRLFRLTLSNSPLTFKRSGEDVYRTYNRGSHLTFIQITNFTFQVWIRLQRLI